MTTYSSRSRSYFDSRSKSDFGRNYVDQTGTRQDYVPLYQGSRRPPSVHSNEQRYLHYDYNRNNDIRTTYTPATNHYTTTVERPPSVINGNLQRASSPGPVAGPGDIRNTEHGFTIQLDVNRFRPEEIKVVLTDDLLSITGERLEYSDDGQTLRRSFARKYSIPLDIHLDSIRSYLTDSGFLVINAPYWR